MSVKTLLKEARRIIEAGWTKGTFARDADGKAVSNDHPEAQCFCTVGALRKAAGPDDPILNPNYRGALYAIRQAVGQYNIPAWNDTFYREKQDVLEKFDKAIEASK